MKQSSKRAGYRQDKRDTGNEHLGFNEARYTGRAYNQDHNQNRSEWDEDYAPRHDQYRDHELQGDHRHHQRNHSRIPGNNFSKDNDPGYANNYRQDRQPYPQRQNSGSTDNDRGRNEAMNADRRIQGSRNYMREEHAYGQSNDRMYEADRGNSRITRTTTTITIMRNILTGITLKPMIPILTTRKISGKSAGVDLAAGISDN